MSNFKIKAEAQSFNMVAKFETDLHNLLAIMGKEEATVLAPGTAYQIYASSGTLSTATVNPKGLIPDSNISMGDPTVATITYMKYRNLVAIEEIGKKGYAVAVGGANNSMLKQIQAKVRKSIVDGLANGTTVVEVASTTSFQARIAKAAAQVQIKFEDEACTPVFFANPVDAYNYLGTTNVGLAQNFGLSYLENFMGIGDVIIDSNVPQGTVYGSAKENLDVISADIRAIEGIDLTMDGSGIIGVHNGTDYSYGALEAVCYCGLCVMPIFADRIVKVVDEEESE